MSLLKFVVAAVGLLALVHASQAYQSCGDTYCYGSDYCCSYLTSTCCSTYYDYGTVYIIVSVSSFVGVGICVAIIACIVAKRRKARMLAFQASYIPPPTMSSVSVSTTYPTNAPGVYQPYQPAGQSNQQFSAYNSAPQAYNQAPPTYNQAESSGKY